VSLPLVPPGVSAAQSRFLPAPLPLLALLRAQRLHRRGPRCQLPLNERQVCQTGTMVS
jgi:hypothetical protein